TTVATRPRWSAGKRTAAGAAKDRALPTCALCGDGYQVAEHRAESGAPTPAYVHDTSRCDLDVLSPGSGVVIHQHPSRLGKRGCLLLAAAQAARGGAHDAEMVRRSAAGRHDDLPASRVD